MTVRINRIDQHSGSWPFVKNCFEPVSYNDHEILEDKYTRHEISFTTDEDISEYVFRVGFYVAEESNSQDYTWSIAGLKLEEGDHATGWDDYWSGDNLLLDTDQPDLNNHNPNISQGLYRQIYSNIPSMISNIEFIRDDDLPETGLLINNKMVINTTVQNSGNYINIYFNHLDSKVDLGVKTGDPVTLSYYIKPHASTYTGEIVLVRVGLSSSKDMGSTILLNSLDANKWNKIVCTVINDENLDLSSGNLVLSYRNIKPAKNMTIEICGMKLEKGAHVTDYRIAPTDFNINYLLNSEVNLTNDEYCITNKFVELISDFNNDTSHMQPLVITMDADINPRRDHFSTYFVLGPSEGGPVNSRGSISPLTYLSLEPRLEKVKSNSYYNYILYGRVPNIDTFEDGRYFGSIFNGLDVYVSPRSERDGANSTIRKIKLELGRYPTKWVDGTGDSAYVPSDEEDDDLEVT